MSKIKDAFADQIEAESYDFAGDEEANAFAMELLMPHDWIVRDSAGVDLSDDLAIERLAKRYRVPNGVMALRIADVRAEAA